MIAALLIAIAINVRTKLYRNDNDMVSQDIYYRPYVIITGSGYLIDIV